MDSNELMRSLQGRAQKFGPKPKAKAQTEPDSPEATADTSQREEDAPHADTNVTPTGEDKSGTEFFDSNQHRWLEIEHEAWEVDTDEQVVLRGRHTEMTREQWEAFIASYDSPESPSMLIVCNLPQGYYVTTLDLPNYPGKHNLHVYPFRPNYEG